MNEYKLNTFCKYLCVLTFCGFIASLGAQMHISNSTALKGKDFRDLHEKKLSLEKEIAYLQYEDSSFSSLVNVELRAAALGFIPMSEPLSLISSPSLASLYSQ